MYITVALWQPALLLTWLTHASTAWRTRPSSEQTQGGNSLAAFHFAIPGSRLQTRSRHVVSMSSNDSKLLQKEATSLLLLLASRHTRQDVKVAALQEVMEAPAEQREALLDAALNVIDNAGNSLFGVRRWPVPLPSKRAALGSYRRLLDSLMREEPGNSARFTQDGDVGKKRRFLSLLFRQLRSGKSGVWGLERESRRNLRRRVSMKEMQKRTPQGLETPEYDVIAIRPNWEVRKYTEFSVASTRRDRPVRSEGVKLQQPSTPMAGGFQALAGYIFGSNKDGNGESEKMAMTTPVFTTSSTGEMSFVLPSRFWQKEAEPPKPLDDSVRIVRKGGGALERSEMLATLWFDGFAGQPEVERRKAELIDAVRADNEWRAACEEDEEQEQLLLLMQYNDPFTPPWKRRNEVALPVRRRDS